MRLTQKLFILFVAVALVGGVVAYVYTQNHASSKGGVLPVDGPVFALILGFAACFTLLVLWVISSSLRYASQRLRRFFSAWPSDSCVREHSTQIEQGNQHSSTDEQSSQQSSQIHFLTDDVLSCLSHELKNPLTSINACAEILSGTEIVEEDTRRELCQIVADQVKHLNRMVDNVLNSSIMEAGMAEISREEIDLADIIADVVKIMAPQAREKDIEVHIELADDDLRAWADKRMINQAISNLLSNALKYSRCGQRVWISVCRNENSQIAIEVRDEGAGIPEQFLALVFDKYYRVAENKHLADGTGLGLNLVQQIVERLHHGYVTVESVQGEGSTFTIYLPLRGASQSQTLDETVANSGQ